MSTSQSLISESGMDLPKPVSLFDAEPVNLDIRLGMTDPVETVASWNAMVESLVGSPPLDPLTLFLIKIRLLKTARRVFEYLT